MLTTPNEHPQLTAVDVRLPTTRGAIGLIALKDRSLSPVAKLFAQSVASCGSGYSAAADIVFGRYSHIASQNAADGFPRLLLALLRHAHWSRRRPFIGEDWK